MSDTVLLALIGMIRSWGEMFVTHLAVIVPAVGTAIIAWMNWRNNRRSELRASDIRAEVEAVKVAAITTSEQAALQAKGAERNGVEIGIERGVEKERKRATDEAELRTRFQGESTDVFMARTDETDQHNQR